MVKMKLNCKIFNLNQTLCCGQVFRWELGPDQWWQGVIEGYFVKIKQVEDELEFRISPKIINPSEFITRYFRLTDNLELIYKNISKDEYIREAIRNAHGLRLICQDPWECMISYMISQQNQIPKIKRSIEILCRKYGTYFTFDNHEFWAFPTPEQLSKANLGELQKGFDKGGCALGYRAKYILSAALLVNNNCLDFSWKDLEVMSYELARNKLQESFCGIGPKVADCILLFSMDKLEAFPLDTWIRKIITNLYLKKKVNDNEIREFCLEYFGDFAGYAQEYLYSNRERLCQQF